MLQCLNRKHEPHHLQKLQAAGAVEAGAVSRVVVPKLVRCQGVAVHWRIGVPDADGECLFHQQQVPANMSFRAQREIFREQRIGNRRFLPVVEMTDSPSTISKKVAFEIPPTPFVKGGVGGRRCLSPVAKEGVRGRQCLSPFGKGGGGISFRSRTAQRAVTGF
jgi:hypothetical protein